MNSAAASARGCVYVLHHLHASPPPSQHFISNLYTRERLSPVLGAVLGEVHDALRVAPLVVVPCDDLDHVVAHNHGEGGVDGGGLEGALEVDGDEGCVGDLEDALHLAGGVLLERGVHLLRERLLLGLHDEVDDGDGGRGHAERDTVELALDFRKDESDGLGRARRGGHDVERCGTRAAQVAVRGVQEALVTGVGVRRGHCALDDAEFLLDDLHEGGHAIGGAGGVRDNGVLVLVVLVVDAHHEGGDVALAGRGDEDLGGTRCKMLARAGLVDEHTGALDHEVHAHLAPGKLSRVTVGHDGDVLAIHGDGLLVDDLHIGVECAEGGVVFQQVGSLLGATGVVDAHDIEEGVATAVPAAEELTANAAEAVDGNLQLLLGGGSHLEGVGAGLAGHSKALARDRAGGLELSERHV
eukprot:TRINITY_DN24741_c0_g2_i2.p2 TRINITY_DN24741_c0_g2~~TRINITY_DN24741_c0_g2_i2.p2  ORF type:complete len:412 (+),score=84.29 TRINITY_DN24741_c0_g2_i2:220-1455(+)